MPDYDRDENGDVLPPGHPESNTTGEFRADGGSEPELKGYLPPEGTQNIHRTAYRYRGAQGAHQVGRSVIHSPESVILTSDEFAQTEAERYGLTEVSSDVADAALDAFLNDGDVEAALAGADVAPESGGSDAEDGSAEDSSDDSVDAGLDDSDAGQWLTQVEGVGPSKADALEDAGYADRDRVADAAVEDLEAVDGVSEADAEAIATFVSDDPEE